MKKHFICANQLLEDSFRLASAVYQSDFKPTFIVAIWRGGTPIGIAVQEYFAYHNVDTDHIAVRTSSYSGIGIQEKQVKVHGLQYLLENIHAEHNLLIVDDVFDSGRSIEALIDKVKAIKGADMPKNVRIACPYYKPKNNKTALVPDYYLHETEQWLVFPHELTGLTQGELLEGKPELANIARVFDRE